MRAAIVAASGLSLPPAKPALAAMYTVVPTGTVAAKQARLSEVEKQFQLTPDDPYVFGEKAQLEYDIGALRKNSAFAEELSREVGAGRSTFCRGMRVGVSNMDEAVIFWTRGCGAQVQSTRMVNGRNTTAIGFGSQSLRTEDGAKFSLELVEGESTAFGDDHPLQYLQLAIPIFRLSQVREYGGELVSAYGWSEVIAPGGLPLRVRIDENRRDPFEFVALRTTDIKAAVKHYEGLGMRKLSETNNRKKLRDKNSLSINSNSIFESGDALEPDRESGSVLMSYGEPSLTTGLLLLPPQKLRLDPGPMPPTLLFIGAPAEGGSLTASDGVSTAYTPADEFETSLRRA